MFVLIGVLIGRYIFLIFNKCELIYFNRGIYYSYHSSVCEGNYMMGAVYVADNDC